MRQNLALRLRIALNWTPCNLDGAYGAALQGLGLRAATSLYALAAWGASMKWYFALSAASLASRDHDWPSLIKTAVTSARSRTNLRPHLLWDGPAHPLLDEMRALGVTVIFHRARFYDALEAYNSRPGYLPTAAGCFLRVDIPVLETEDEFVLYTDADVIFLRDPEPILRDIRPAYFACTSEFTFDDGLNSGVLWLNVAAMRQDYAAFTAFIRANLQLGLDQDMYRAFYRDRFEKMPPALNWKPYWGRHDNAVILHWHGVKPVVVRRLMADPAARTNPDLERLVTLDPEGYRYYINLLDGLAARPRPPDQSPRYGVVLVVKNEISDIGHWLAWYHCLGFDTCIVFDDDSDDGTWELLHQAAKVQDIRMARTLGSRAEVYQSRQDRSYRFAIDRYAAEFEWLAFFDADEFLWLPRDRNIQEFLARFPLADQVCINWCNYGSSGHYLKPSQSPAEAYTWHGTPEKNVNRHVKSIIRPHKAGPAWVNVHCYDIPLSRSIMANGEPVSWSQTNGIIDRNPDWSGAKIMHYQCRSMEHFIERLKKRPQFQNQRNLWESYDYKQVEDKSPLQLVPRANIQLNAIIRGTVSAPASNLIFDIGMSEGNDSAFYLAKGFRVVGVEADVKAYYELCERFADEIGAGRMKIENFAASDRADRLLEFFHHNLYQGLSGLSRARPEFNDGNFSGYYVSTINWPALVARHGVPYYLKIDIEGAELLFLASMAGADMLPAYISAECHSLAVAEALYALGYRHFKLVDQNPPGGFSLPATQHEGQHINWPKFQNSSGPFGKDLPDQPWHSLDNFKLDWHAARDQMSRTWFDCHASLG
jgi:FkbM family methyltransferase